MRLRTRSARAVVGVLACLFLPSFASAAEPPDQNDPCSTGGVNSCGTNGDGITARYRYGIRWFGDFHGAVANEAHTFCIDLRFWYPAARYRYEAREITGLRSRAGSAVSALNQQKMAFALWRYGRSTSDTQQAAVMLYVHSLMGDAAPGEVDPSAVSPAVAAQFAQIGRDAARLHGPYRLDASVSGGLTVAKPATITVRVRSAAGIAMPNVKVALTGDGAPEARATTNSQGVARIAFTPSTAGGLAVEVQATDLPSTLPKLYAPAVPAAARSGQRLVAPDSQVVTQSLEATIGKSRITLSTVATPSAVVSGATVVDTVTIKGAAASWRGAVAVKIFGPAATAAEIRCDGQPVWTGSFSGRGSGTVTTPPATLAQPGWYAYQEVVPDDAGHVGLTTPCGVPSETFKVQARPAVTTVVSADRVVPGTPITDTLVVSGLAGQAATVQASLFGPFASAATITCDGQPVWTGSVAVTGDGEYRTGPFTPTVPGYYTYRESIAASDTVLASETACADTAETTIVSGAPQIQTRVSAAQVKPGASITDAAVVTGLGALSATVQVELWGPFDVQSAIVCTGTPYWTGTFPANGDGTYTTAPVRLEKAGYYTYREAILEGPANAAVTTACGESTETTLVSSKPIVTTIASSEVLAPGAKLSDRIRVSGLGKTSALIDVELFGPFATRDAISCDGTPFWKGRVTAPGDGTLTSPPVALAKVGFYTFRERIAGSANVGETVTECALAPETALAAPQIVTGRGDVAREVRRRTAGPTTPTRVRVPSLRIDAPVEPIGIDVQNGVLGVPVPIARTGWWRDGAVPGSATGSILIAGHVDSATAGAGAFFRLATIKAGDRIELATQGGRLYAYRVVSVRRYRKDALPATVYSQRGPARLTLVTCGGVFDAASGHYRDNVVVIATPA